VSTLAPAPARRATGEEKRAEFRAFVDREVAPFAGAWDRARATPPEVIRQVARAPPRVC
jgi:hypothetical protein